MPKFSCNHDSNARLPPGHNLQTVPRPPNNYRQQARESFDGPSSAPRLDNYPVHIGGKCRLPNVKETNCKDHCSLGNGGSVSKFKSPPPRQANQMASLRHSNEDDAKPTAKAVMPYTGYVSTMPPNNRYISVGPPMERLTLFNPDGESAPGRRINGKVQGLGSPPHSLPPLRFSPASPTPFLGGIPPPRAPFFPSALYEIDSSIGSMYTQQQVQTTDTNTEDNYQDKIKSAVEYMRNYGSDVAFQNGKVVWGKRKASLDSVGANDSTKDINFTISKDSCADEGVRQAKLLAEMGDRSLRNRNGNGTVGESNVAQSDDLLKFFRLE